MPINNLSVQLWTLRELIAEDLVGTLQRLADVGFTKVEPYRIKDAEGLGTALRDAGLEAPTTHQVFIRDDSIDEVAEAAARFGIGTVIDPVVAPEFWTDASDIQRTAERLNAAASIAAKHGVTVGYHNHAHEIRNKIDGRPALEYFASLLDPSVVLEVDTYWVAVGGEDPAQLLPRLGDRVVAIHVKDGPATAEKKDQVPVGRGSLNIPGIIAAAPNALRVIELDDSRMDRFDAVVESFTYLSELEGHA
ncbi:MAG: sugar phosphate isomerase/epimerase [Microbacterium sp.]